MDVDSKSKWVDKKNDDSCPQQSEKCEILLNFYNYILNIINNILVWVYPYVL